MDSSVILYMDHGYTAVSLYLKECRRVVEYKFLFKYKSDLLQGINSF